MAISDITKNTTRYTVVKGDTFSEIAARCITVEMSGYAGLKLYNDGINKLKSFNPDVENESLIYVGQVITLQGTAAAKTTNNTQRVKITNFGLQSNTDRTVFATWSWNKSNTDHYEVKWKYGTGDGVAFEGTNETVKVKQSVYSSAPENATHVAVYVRPISKTYKKGDKEVRYWTADWSAVKKYYFKDNPPSVPPVPTVTISDNKLTAKLENLDVNAKEIQYQIVKNDSSVYRTVNAKISTTTSSCSCSVQAGYYYKVRCRAVRDGLYSDWSGYSTSDCSAPAAPKGIHTLRALSELSNRNNQFVVEVNWYDSNGAHGYEIQYTTNPRYFDSNTTEVKSVVIGSKDEPAVVGHAEISGLAGGSEYYFRVRSVTYGSKAQYSAWCEVESITLGQKPTAPTTWSSSTTVVTGKPLTLYWVHNSVDGSSQTTAQLELTTTGMVNGTYVNKTEVIDVPNSVDPDEKDKTSFYEIDTSTYAEGVKLKWRVKTAGVLTDDNGKPEYGDWSTPREVDIYATPTVALLVTDSQGSVFDELHSYPMNITAVAGPNTQKPIGYHLTITANETYETVDNVGNRKLVNKDAAVYSKFFDTSNNPLDVILSAGDLDLANNISYTLTCTVSMNSGLTAEDSITFTVTWIDAEEYWPNAEIAYDGETFTTSIRPFCEDESGQLIDGITLSVYRREFDGSFTELATGLNNVDSTYITDPHPSLDYARYRVVAVTESTGAVAYYDVPGFPIDEKAIILQWDEDWVNFNVDNEEEWEQPTWSGSLLKLMYNVDISDAYEKDSELIEYTGREHPVSYYGTQIGHTASWAVEIPKYDEETVYALRRLARWRGNVYVREPSGSGYWADVSVSFSQTHRELTIPVTLDIKRVEGGI